MAEDSEEKSTDGYFDGLQDGCGCAEIWEYMSQRRSKLQEEED
ncbi:MAG: hypothetical protein ABEI06_07495 [Halobacteriaceae archaeon]